MKLFSDFSECILLLSANPFALLAFSNNDKSLLSQLQLQKIKKCLSALNNFIFAVYLVGKCNFLETFSTF